MHGLQESKGTPARCETIEAPSSTCPEVQPIEAFVRPNCWPLHATNTYDSSTVMGLAAAELVCASPAGCGTIHISP